MGIARNERGQTAVEFALVAPILIVLVLAIIQVGVAFHDYVTITDAARAGARKAIVARLSGGNLTDAQQAVRNSASGLNQAKLGVSVTDPTDPTWKTSGSLIVVTATYPYKIDIPLLGLTIVNRNLTAVAKEDLE
jgi:Flp pilus assembly protein TadG